MFVIRHRRLVLSSGLLAGVILVSAVTGAQQAMVRITGAIAKPVPFTAQDLAAMPRVTVRATSHDQTALYEGVAMRELLTRAGVPAGEALRGAELAKGVLVTGADGYQAAFGIAEFDAAFTDRVSILADRKDGKPLDGSAAPFQLILMGENRPARWVRQVVSIEIVNLKR